MVSQPEDRHDAWEGVLQPWTDAWLKWLEQNEQYQSVLSSCVPRGMDLPLARKQWLEALSRHLDATMRSPAFLDSMRRNLETWCEAQQRFQSSGRPAAAPTPAADSVSSAMEEVRTRLVRLQASQEVMAARLREIEQRLAALEAASRRGPRYKSGDR